MLYEDNLQVNTVTKINQEINHQSITNLQSHIYNPNFQYQSPTSTKTPTIQSTQTLIFKIKLGLYTIKSINADRGVRDTSFTIE